MRLSPKSIFFCIVALGLPFAVAVGWTLGRPVTSPAAIHAPAGSGTLGAAPPVTPSVAISDVDWSTRLPRARSTGGARAVRTAASGAASVTPSAPASVAPTPARPPAPTPTQVTSAPPTPSATPSPSTSPEPTGLGLVRRQ